MNSNLIIPRVLIPTEDFEKWAVIACDRFASDRAYWDRVEEEVGDTPSSLRVILPEIFGGKDSAARLEEIRETTYQYLESGALEKLNRGFIMTERTTMSGVRRGIVAAIDLEEVSAKQGERASVRTSEEVAPEQLSAYLALRRASVLEFPHALLFYRDKKKKIAKKLEKEDLEELYNFDLMEGGGRLAGYFIPLDLSILLAEELETRATPALAVADGNPSVAAAKAYWEELKVTLKGAERSRHPARYMLAELINLYDDAVDLYPIHRIVRGTDREALAQLLQKSVKCKRVGNVLHITAKGLEAIAKCDRILADFIKRRGGEIGYVRTEEELGRAAAGADCLGVMLRPIEKDDFFDYLEDGSNLPANTFSIGDAREARYYFEGREISYD